MKRVLVVWRTSMKHPVPAFWVLAHSDSRSTIEFISSQLHQDAVKEVMTEDEFVAIVGHKPVKGHWYLFRDQVGESHLIGRSHTSAAMIKAIHWIYYSSPPHPSNSDRYLAIGEIINA